jgi:endoglucanase
MIGAKGGTIPAVDYDLGVVGAGLCRQGHGQLPRLDRRSADPVEQRGRTGRNDGVDLAPGDRKVTDFSAGEWLRYTISAAAGRYAVSVVGTGPMEVSVNSGAAMKSGAIVTHAVGDQYASGEIDGRGMLSAIKSK